MPPLKVFLSHSSIDKPLVEQVKGLLEQGGYIECWLDKYEIGLGGNIVSRISDGLGRSDFLLLFLSRESLRSLWVEEEWTAAYYAQTNSRETRLIPVLIDDCQLPAILANKKYCDLRTNRLEGIRLLKAELLRGRVASNESNARARLPYFVGREAEMHQLRERLSLPGALVPITGMPGIGKTYLAREFVRRHGDLFHAVYELNCEKRDLAALTGELTAMLAIHPKGDAAQVATQLRQLLAAKRCLLFLDNVEDTQPGQIVPHGLASVLITSRSPSIAFFANYPDVDLALFTEPESLDLFRSVLGTFDEDRAKLLFKKLGYLPIAIAVSAGLIKHDLRYSIESLENALPPIGRLAHGADNVGRLLNDAISGLDRGGPLLEAMAACAPGGFSLALAAEIAGLAEIDSLDALQQIYERSMVIEIDRASRRYRLHPLIREAGSPSAAIRERHAEAVLRGLEKWERAPIQSASLIDEAEHALVFPGDPFPAAQIAVLAGNLCRALGRLSQALELYERLGKLSLAASRKDWLQRSYGGQALIFKAWGRLEEAMALHKREEAICEELGDRAGLQASYGNQALILQAWGRLEEAMALHKREEAICEELGDRAGLQRNYGNQAVILKDWGRLEEAMALHKKKEAICEEFGDRAGLQASYGNQALILQAWGRLEEAMALHKKQEAICEELGDRAGLQRNYGNQAVILKDWGRLEEAMALHKKKEAICEELGDRASLAYSHWNQGGLLAQANPQSPEARKMMESALKLFTEIGMVRQRDAVQENLKRLAE